MSLLIITRRESDLSSVLSSCGRTEIMTPEQALDADLSVFGSMAVLDIRRWSRQSRRCLAWLAKPARKSRPDEIVDDHIRIRTFLSSEVRLAFALPPVTPVVYQNRAPVV